MLRSRTIERYTEGRAAGEACGVKRMMRFCEVRCCAVVCGAVLCCAVLCWEGEGRVSLFSSQGTAAKSLSEGGVRGRISADFPIPGPPSSILFGGLSRVASQTDLTVCPGRP